MVSYDLSLISMLIDDIVEDKGALWDDGRISWISIYRGSYNGKRVQVFDGDFRPYTGVGVLSGAAYNQAGSWSVSGV